MRPSHTRIAVAQLVELAGLGAEHAPKMLGGLAVKGGGARIEGSTKKRRRMRKGL